MLDGIMKKLHEDVVIHILLELPVKSLMRFRSISKLLYTLIHSSIFINLHRNRRRNTKDELLILKRPIFLDENLYKNILYFLSSNDNDDDTLKHVSPEIDVPYFDTDFCVQFQQLLGSSHGLIALTDFEDIVFLNPTTRKYRLLPHSPFRCPKDFVYVTRGIGFGYDSIEKDYKVVRFYELSSEPYDRDFDARHSRVEVYDFCTDTWRWVIPTVKLLPRVHRYVSSEAFFGGACHWTAQDDEAVPIVLCFHLTSEFFRNIKMPDTCHFCDNQGYGLTVCQNTLTLICYPHPKCHIEPGQEFTDIWLIKEYGEDETWIRKYTLRPLPIESTFAIWKDHVLLFQTGTGTLSSYDIHSNQLNEFGYQGNRGTLRLLVYNETLTIIPRESNEATQVLNF
ncbi:F-box protein CPR30-like [Solanum tuberosum]|uniref:S-locus F-box a n=1 Tax=Solanum tuberosum TaxID=4113 RepID=M1CJ06_SOLTU|nr:PREDICTED: F-box protein CPR30-like [Solanum tuberosum]